MVVKLVASTLIGGAMGFGYLMLMKAGNPG
jgi:hypothetical protein